MVKPRVAMVADDFTGANDASGCFAQAGFSAWAACGDAPAPSAADVEAINCQSRFYNRDEARKRSSAAWRKQAQRGLAGRWLFQKIDSTLRGWPGQEILGMLEVSQASFVCMVAAYPQQGRTTRHGIHRVHGTELRKTEYARDLVSPARVSRPVELFERGFARGLNLGTIRAGRAKLKAEIRRALSDGVRVLSFDCVESRDLKLIVDACMAEGCRAFAGASGLARALARKIHSGKKADIKRASLPRRGLVLAGSISATSLAQLAECQKRGYDWHAVDWNTKSLEINPGSLENWACSLHAKGGLCLSSIKNRSSVKKKNAEERAQLHMLRMTQAAKLLGVLQSRVCVMLTGGHTAEVFFEKLGLQGNWVTAELQPGLPLLRAEGPGGHAWLCSKPGGFGRLDSMTGFFRYLKTAQEM